MAAVSGTNQNSASSLTTSDVANYGATEEEKQTLQKFKECLLEIDRYLSYPGLSENDRKEIKKLLDNSSWYDCTEWSWKEVLESISGKDSNLISIGTINFDSSWGSGIQHGEADWLVQQFRQVIEPKLKKNFPNVSKPVNSQASAVKSTDSKAPERELTNGELYKNDAKLLELFLNGDYEKLKTLDNISQQKLQLVVQNYTTGINLISTLQKTMHDCQLQVIRNI